jgi:putative membrane protein insertion efficiency factor
MHVLIILCLVVPVKYETNPLKIVVNSSLHAYQKFISPGQGDVCNFSPSCSHFAKEAISEHGPLWGTLMAADRLMRCNPWAYTHYGTYYREIKNYKLYDPVENNFIFEKRKRKDTTRISVFIDLVKPK